ncbi:hypothetical protein MLPF_3052 [Mycobacterium lepromatosis]|nr:hypothetical protein MLPF_3052 [Mycobacterium lepromatosis]
MSEIPVTIQANQYDHTMRKPADSLKRSDAKSTNDWSIQVRQQQLAHSEQHEKQKESDHLVHHEYLQIGDGDC